MEPEATGTDIVRYEPPTTTTVDLRNANTDSWTDVLESVADLANKIAGTDFVPTEYRGKPGQVAAAILHGRELGLAPMTSLAMTNPIKGKPTISAEGMRSLVLQAGHDLVVAESTGSRCILKGRRRGSEDWTSVTWTLDDARQAGLSGNAWRNYPRQMLAARATAELCRLVFPDVIHGLRAAEELADDIDRITEPADPTPTPTTTVRRRPRKPKTKAEPEPVDGPPPERQHAELPAPKDAGTKSGDNDQDRPDRDSTPGPSIEQQQDEIRRLSARRRELRDGDPSSSPSPVAVPPSDQDQQSAGGTADVDDGRPTGPKITTKQNAALMMHWGRLGMMPDRDERLLTTNVLLGYDPDTITSSNDLRDPEVSTLLGILERLKDRDQLDRHLSGQDQLT